MKILKLVSRIIIGVVFIFSGTVKAIDPLGTVYKLQDYLQAFHLTSLKEFSFLLTILLCTFEFIAGFSVLFNIRQKTGIIMVTILMAIFTPLTLVLAITNPVSDCGCFGDAVHLTNWQTFFKNLVLLIPSLYLLFTIKEAGRAGGLFRQWSGIAIAAVLFVAFIFYNLRYLPVIDFLPYKVGTNIPGKMIIPEGKPVDKYETTLIYSRNGVKKEFDLSNYPANDTTWKFVEQKSKLVSRGYQPPIHDLSFTSETGEDLTQKILNSDDYTLLLISRKLREADPSVLTQGFFLGEKYQESNISFYVITSSGVDVVSAYNDDINFCYADETTLKTMVRSNPGYILLRSGTILGKWSWANVPDVESLKKYIIKE